MSPPQRRHRRWILRRWLLSKPLHGNAVLTRRNISDHRFQTNRQPTHGRPSFNRYISARTVVLKKFQQDIFFHYWRLAKRIVRKTVETVIIVYYIHTAIYTGRRCWQKDCTFPRVGGVYRVYVLYFPCFGGFRRGLGSLHRILNF
jgi:hypothetical protein